MNKWLENTWNDTVFWREVKQEKEHEEWSQTCDPLLELQDEAALKDKSWVYVSIWGKGFPSEENT